MQLALRKRTKKKRRDGRVRSQKHLNFVRKHACLVDHCEGEPIQAHHVGDTPTAAMALKPSDEWAVPLCESHHRTLHNMGASTFEKACDVDLREAALWFAKRSPDPAIKDSVKDE